MLHPLSGGVANYRLPLCSAQYFRRNTIDSITRFPTECKQKLRWARQKAAGRVQDIA